MSVKSTSRKITPPQEIAFSDADIRLRSYLIWEREGRPQGRDKIHWQMAIAELLSSQKSNAASLPGKKKKAAAGKPAKGAPGSGNCAVIH